MPLNFLKVVNLKVQLWMFMRLIGARLRASLKEKGAAEATPFP